jgi:hypothetical protein
VQKFKTFTREFLYSSSVKCAGARRIGLCTTRFSMLAEIRSHQMVSSCAFDAFDSACTQFLQHVRTDLQANRIEAKKRRCSAAIFEQATPVCIALVSGITAFWALLSQQIVVT